jgi:hypothetical protein
MISRLISNFNPSAPYKSLQALADIYNRIKTLPAGYWREEKLKETKELIFACSGLWLEASVPEAYALRNQTIPVTLRAVNRSPVSIRVNSISLNHQDTSWNQELSPGVNYSLVRRISLRNLPISQPYWLVQPMSPGSYNVHDQTLIGRPENPPVLEAVFEISLSGQSFSVTHQVFYKYTDAVKGELFEPLTIVPAQMAYCDPDLLVFTMGREKELIVRKQLKTARDGDEEKPVIHPALLSSEKKLSSAPLSISLTPVPGFETRDIAASEFTHDFILKSARADNQNAGTWVTRSKDGLTDTLMQCRTISYDHIPRIDYFKPAKSTVVSVNLKISGKRIGYIEGAGDKVPMF